MILCSSYWHQNWFWKPQVQHFKILLFKRPWRSVTHYKLILIQVRELCSSSALQSILSLYHQFVSERLLCCSKKSIKNSSLYYRFERVIRWKTEERFCQCARVFSGEEDDDQFELLMRVCEIVYIQFHRQALQKDQIMQHNSHIKAELNHYE